MDESVLRHVVDTSPDPIVIVNNDGRVTYANHAIGKILGLTSDALLGERADSLFSGWPDSSHLQRLATEGISLDLAGRITDGEEVLLSCSVRTIENGETQFAAFLREHESLKVEHVINTLPDVFYAFDVDGSLFEWNDRLSTVTGYDDAELASMTPLDFVPEDEREMIADAIEEVLSNDRVVTCQSTLVTKTGERIPYEFNGSRLTDTEGNAVGFVGTRRNVAERDAAVRELRREKEQFESLVQGVEEYAIFMLDPEGNVQSWNSGAERIKGYGQDEIVGEHFSTFYTDEDVADGIPEQNLAKAVEQGFVEDEGWRVRADGSLFWANVVITVLRTETGVLRGFVKITRDMTDRRERDQRLAQQRDELATLNRINIVIRDLVLGLVSAVSREDVEEILCTRLAESDLYRFAWVGERDLNGGVVAREHAGDDKGFHELAASVAEKTEWDRPAAATLRDGDCRVVRDIPGETTFPDSIRTAALKRGIHSGIAVPLTYGSISYGLLVVYATRSNAFSEREAAGFKVLGEISGFVINAIEREKLLISDSVLELTFRVSAPNALLADLSERADCTLALEGAVPTSDGAYLYYVHVIDAPPERVVGLIADVPAVADYRLISSHDDEGDVALTVTSSLVQTLTDAGVIVRSTRAERGKERVIVEAPYDADVRSLVTMLRADYPSINLVAKQEVDRPIRTAREFREQLVERLTTHQRAALQSAYFAGYFDWPRASTAEEVASSMGISSATFHQHLRKAQAKLAVAFFGDSSV